MTNFIFSIRGIFSECLSQNKVEGYYIGPYQRGYKWKSKTIHDHIPVLLTDLYEAFLKSQKSKSNQEYFLQYITVKKTAIKEKYYFEVIDGQQRLTTLTLLCNVLEKYFQIKNIAKKERVYLLSYARYESTKENIFDLTLDLLDIDGLSDNDINEQDKFYMLQASISINSFFKILKENSKENEFEDFVDYLLGNDKQNGKVKIILNKEDEFTSAEEVFSSLNANKVPLTNSYLIKALLLTKASRTVTESQARKHFKEIMDERAIMGRTWDEMNSWFSQPEVCTFYFGNKTDGLEKMLELIEFDTVKSDSDIIAIFRKSFVQTTLTSENNYELFNRFHENILTPEDSLECLNNVKHLYKRLRSWFEDNEFYNLLGYTLITTKDSQNKLIDFHKLNNTTLLKTLKKNVVNKLPKEEGFIKLKYDQKSTHIEIRNLLLALSVFPESTNGNKGASYRYDFYSHINENWSLEHIFPQNPNLNKLKIKDDKDWVIEKIVAEIKKLEPAENESRINDLNITRTSILNNEEISTDNISFIFDEINDVDNLGNMALLSGSVNSALSNGFFNTKRKILLQKINGGSFVPKHTIDVFSKMLELPKYSEENEIKGFDPTLTIWSDNDIQSHLEWIKLSTNKIKEKFSI